MRAVAIIGLLLCVVAARRVGAQTFSPGDLAEPHHKLEGLSNCTKCHEEGKQLSAALCLQCHTDVRKRIAAHTGFHGKLPASDRDQCQTCHKDHQGTNAKMIDWGRGIAQFDHNRTGYPLRGKHAKEKCQTCHEPRRIVDSGVLATLAKEPKKQTWLGVGKTCTTCHFDEHRGQEGSDCERCHNEAAWKPAPKFEHQKTGFPLAGKHRGVACRDCHADERDSATHAPFPSPLANTFMRLSPVPHARCVDCHQDPHGGKFSKNCQSCHTVEGWTTLKKSTEREFHDKTAFPLKGAHKEVACTVCHGPWPGRPAKFRGLAFAQCKDCHQDAHRGQLTAACETCHDVERFVPARFEIEDHQKTKYPLDGAHGAVPCTSCHLPTATNMATAANTKIANAPASRSKTKKDTKRSAHPASAVVIAESAWQFHPRGDTARCETCHRDEHAGQLARFDDGCRHCHSTATFERVAFDHKESRFALTGKHATTACASCHKEATIAGRKTTRYRPLETACVSCHRDEHFGQFKSKSCDTCHGTEQFKPSTFSHDRSDLTTYRLEGKHAKTPCAGCHKPVVAAGVSVVRYRPLPRQCESCHDDFHKGDFRGFVP